MVTLQNGQQIFIGDIIDVKTSELICSGKVIKFMEVSIIIISSMIIIIY